MQYTHTMHFFNSKGECYCKVPVEYVDGGKGFMVPLKVCGTSCYDTDAVKVVSAAVRSIESSLRLGGEGSKFALKPVKGSQDIIDMYMEKFGTDTEFDTFYTDAMIPIDTFEV
jgi:hypothetical protein